MDIGAIQMHHKLLLFMKKGIKTLDRRRRKRRREQEEQEEEEKEEEKERRREVRRTKKGKSSQIESYLANRGNMTAEIWML